MSGRDVSCILVRDSFACVERNFVVILRLFVTFEVRFIVEIPTSPKLDPISVVNFCTFASDVIFKF